MSGKFASYSSYCPLQLFGTPKEQINAILSLIKSPQNNFILTINNTKVTISDINKLDFGISEDDFYTFVKEKWSEFDVLKSSSLSLNEQYLCIIILQLLNANSLLADLLHLQVRMKASIYCRI
jgi:hypothetical protein